MREYEYFDKYTHETKMDNLDGYHQINHHWTKDFYGEENAKILDKVSEIAYSRWSWVVKNTTTTMIFRVTTLMLLLCEY